MTQTPEVLLMAEIARKGATVKSMARLYADAIESSEPCDWGAVNSGLVCRYSVTRLNSVKLEAWELLRRRRLSGV